MSFYGGICVCAICARSATILRTERTSNKITIKSHTKSTLPRKLKTTSKKCRFESQNASQNRPRRPGRAPGPPPARDFRQKNFHFWLLPGSKSASKSKLEFDVILERFWCHFRRGPRQYGGARGRGFRGVTCGNVGGFRKLVFPCTFPSLRSRPLLSLNGSVAGFKGLRPPAAGPQRLVPLVGY